MDAMMELAEGTARVSNRHDGKSAWIDIQLDIWEAYLEKSSRDLTNNSEEKDHAKVQ